MSPFIQILDKVIMLSYIFYAQKHCSVIYYHAIYIDDRYIKENWLAFQLGWPPLAPGLKWPFHNVY